MPAPWIIWVCSHLFFTCRALDLCARPPCTTRIPGTARTATTGPCAARRPCGSPPRACRDAVWHPHVPSSFGPWWNNSLTQWIPVEVLGLRFRDFEVFRVKCEHLASCFPNIVDDWLVVCPRQRGFSSPKTKMRHLTPKMVGGLVRWIESHRFYLPNIGDSC